MRALDDAAEAHFLPGFYGPASRVAGDLRPPLSHGRDLEVAPIFGAFDASRIISTPRRQFAEERSNDRAPGGSTGSDALHRRDRRCAAFLAAAGQLPKRRVRAPALASD